MFSGPTPSPNHSRASAGRLCCGAAIGVLALTLIPACKQDAPSAGSTRQADPVALNVGDKSVRLSELQAELDFLRARHSPVATERGAFVGASVERLVALEKARELGLDQDMELRRQWENLLIGRLKQTELDSRIAEVEVSDSEIQEYYQRNLDTYATPAQVHLALLFLKVPRHADDAARAAVAARLEEAKSLALNLPADTRGFGQHAMTFSEDATSRFKGGDIGWVQAGASQPVWPAAVVAAGFGLQDVGSLSEVIATEDGYYLLKKLDSRPAAVRSLEGRFRATLEGTLLKEKRAALEAQLKDDWKAAATVTLHQDVLSGLKFLPVAEQAATESLPPAP